MKLIKQQQHNITASQYKEISTKSGHEKKMIPVDVQCLKFIYLNILENFLFLMCTKRIDINISIQNSLML